MKVIGSFLGKLHVLGKILHSRCFHVAWQILIHLIFTPLIQCPPLLKLGFTSTFQFRMLLIRGQFSWNRNAAALGAIHTNWSTMPHSSVEMWILRQGWGGAHPPTPSLRWPVAFLYNKYCAKRKWKKKTVIYWRWSKTWDEFKEFMSNALNVSSISPTFRHNRRQLPHSLVVHPLLRRRILAPPLCACSTRCLAKKLARETKLWLSYLFLQRKLLHSLPNDCKEKHRWRS